MSSGEGAGLASATAFGVALDLAEVSRLFCVGAGLGVGSSGPVCSRGSGLGDGEGCGGVVSAVGRPGVDCGRVASKALSGSLFDRRGWERGVGEAVAVGAGEIVGLAWFFRTALAGEAASPGKSTSTASLVSGGGDAAAAALCDGKIFNRSSSEIGDFKKTGGCETTK